MNFGGAQIHLMMNHLPIVGFVLLTPLVGYFALKGDLRSKRFALLTVFGISLLALPAFFTGEPAEESVEHLVGISENQIHAHEEMAENALKLGLLTGGLAIAGYLLGRKREEYLAPSTWIVFVASVLTTSIMAKTGHEGGKIRHTELSQNGSVAEPVGNLSKADGGKIQESDDDE